jgi:hypothetical protein
MSKEHLLHVLLMYLIFETALVPINRPHHYWKRIRSTEVTLATQGMDRLRFAKDGTVEVERKVLRWQMRTADSIDIDGIVYEIRFREKDGRPQMLLRQETQDKGIPSHQDIYVDVESNDFP